MKRGALIPSLLNEIQDIRDFFDFDVEPISDFFKQNGGLTIYENEDKIFVEAAVPGVASKDVQVNFEKGILWIKGESKKERGNVRYHAKSIESFSYRIPIPQSVDEKNIPGASYKDGVIKITFLKSKAAQPKKIEVKEED